MELKNLKTKILGRRCIYYNEIDSTQDEILRLIENKNIENGTLVIANIQTNGRGTHGRKWYTDENNIAFSFYEEKNCDIMEIKDITLDIARHDSRYF